MQTPAWARAPLGAVQRSEGLDRIAARVAEASRRVLDDGALADVLRGRWLGHPLHPALTDLPIGFWTCASVLDLVGGDDAAPAARTLVGWGVVAAVPTALAGLVDWRDIDDPGPRRVGTVHAALNTAALACYAGSWALRRGRRSALGLALGMAGATAASVAGFLGGELVFPSDLPDAVDAPTGAGADGASAYQA